jgi:hypothetical protein
MARVVVGRRNLEGALMNLRDHLEDLCRTEGGEGGFGKIELTPGRDVKVLRRSVRWQDGWALMIGGESGRRRLIVVDFDGTDVLDRFSGERLEVEPGVAVCLGDLDHQNAVAVRSVCEAARPQPLGLHDSFGLGDRLGIAGPAHLQAMRGSGFKVVLAQQSIRELERTERTPDEVMDAATWAVVEEGWNDAWGADADHLKTPADVELMAEAGFTMFTIDPGDHVVDAADDMDVSELEREAAGLSWADLETTMPEALARYGDGAVEVGPELTIDPTPEDVLQGWVKYGASLAHTARMYRHIASTMGDRPFEVEVSVDETASVTSPFEHWLVASELRRLGVRWIGLAPRFVGDFEKGIDYRGDLEVFRTEYVKHLAIADRLGPYKISIHSGSDKFGVYRVIGEIGRGGVHVKTAGTSYLEALRTIAACEPVLFREILDFSRSLYEHERRTYHVSAVLDRVPGSSRLADGDLPALFESEDARQVLHVTFGRVLTEKSADGGFLFKTRVLAALDEHEATHFANLVKHFRRHTAPFGTEVGEQS